MCALMEAGKEKERTRSRDESDWFVQCINDILSKYLDVLVSQSWFIDR